MNRPPLSDIIHFPLVCLVRLLLTMVQILYGQYLYVSKCSFLILKTDVCSVWKCKIKIFNNLDLIFVGQP